jgi:iron(III) transport system permease protein
MIFVTTSVILMLLFVTPLWLVVRGGFFVEGKFTLRYLSGVFQNPIYAEGMFNSLMLAVGTTAIVTLIAVPLAWLSNRYDFAGKSVLSGLVLVPMILPPFVGAIGFQQILGHYGTLNVLLGIEFDWLGRAQYFGVILLQALGLYPIMYLNATAALANVDPAMEEVAENLGCTGMKKFFRITLPLIMPGLFAGGTIVFIWSFTELGTPLIMNYHRCAPVQVFDALKEIGTNPFPYALVFVMLAASVAMYVISKLLFGRHSYAMQSKAATVSVAKRARGWRAVAIPLLFGLVILVALTPHFGVIATSFAVPGSWYRSILPLEFTTDNYVEALGHSMTVNSIRNSLLYSSLAVALNVVLGIAIAMVVVRSSIPFRGVLDALAMLPLAVPGLVMAFGYLALSSQFSNMEWVKNSQTWQNVFDVRTNPTVFLVIAYAVRRMPFMVRSAAAGLQQTSVTLEEAAANLGAGSATTLRRITLPLITANLIAGGLLTFSFSMLEVSDSLILAQRQDYYPITKTIYELFRLIGTGKYIASGLGVWAMVFLAVTILGSSLILGRKLGAVFRA